MYVYYALLYSYTVLHAINLTAIPVQLISFWQITHALALMIVIYLILHVYCAKIVILIAITVLKPYAIAVLQAIYWLIIVAYAQELIDFNKTINAQYVCPP